MFSKALIFALVAAVSCVPYGTLDAGYYGAGLGAYGVPVYRSSALIGGLAAANGYGYGANLGRVAGIGALRTGAIIGSGALGYGTGVIGGVPAVGHLGLGLGHLGLGAHGLSVHQAGPVNAAVQTIARTVDYRAIPNTGEPAVVQDIDVGPQESPLRINFQSKSSPLAVTQAHIPAEPGQVQHTRSEDEPQTAIHTVVRPIHQQVNEIVQPFRSLHQTVEPVIEQTHTNIAQGEGVRLTGLTTGVVGGTGVVAANGIGLVGGRGLINSGIYGSGLIGNGVYGTGLINRGVYGTGLINRGVYGHGLAGVYGTGITKAIATPAVYGTGLVDGLSGLSTKILRY